MTQQHPCPHTLGPATAPLWPGYADISPSAVKIHHLLAQRGEEVHNDHVALRTYNLAPINLQALAAPLLEMGYRPSGEYHFDVKRLDARSYSKPGWPRVFISELRVQDMPQNVQDTLNALVEQCPNRALTIEDLAAGRPWAPVSWETYQNLAQASQYAAWVAAFGLRANHFTVSVNHLKTFDTPVLANLNAWLQTQGFTLNTRGGAIKGDPQCGLEQSSTMADHIEVDFADGVHAIPSCYCEFALRHPGPDGTPFDGFVTQSANRIFESTAASS